MAAYIVFEINVSDPSWRDGYLKPTADLVKKHGGRYLAVGPVEKMEGDRDPPDALVILEFPSAKAAKAWHGDVDYQPLIKLRWTGSTAEALLVSGQ